MRIVIDRKQFIPRAAIVRKRYKDPKKSMQPKVLKPKVPPELMVFTMMRFHGVASPLGK